MSKSWRSGLVSAFIWSALIRPLTLVTDSIPSIAQVEVLLKETTGNNGAAYQEKTFDDFNLNLPDTGGDVYLQGLDFGPMEPMDGVPGAMDPSFTMQNDAAEPMFAGAFGPSTDPSPGMAAGGGGGFELVDLGFSETLPPPELIEDLHRSFFETQVHIIPIIHPRRYIQAFYSPPHMKPPMSLQYSMWALASE
jgi:hypothetical protein